MITYTITAEDEGNNVSATGYIHTDRPLSGSEPIIAQRFSALVPLLEPEDSFTKEFKKVIVGGLK